MNSYPGMVWLRSDNAAINGIAKAFWKPYLTTAENIISERTRQARLLYRGQHRQFFLVENRSQYAFTPINVGGRQITTYVPLNVLALVTRKSADLLFGEAPQVRVENARAQTAIDSLVERSNLHRTLFDAAIDASWSGRAYLEVSLYNRQSFVETIPPDEMFAVGAMMPDGQYAAYKRLAVENVGTIETPRWLLLEVNYTAGRIERHVYELTETHEKRGEVALDQWPAFKGRSIQAVEPTGLSMPSIVFIANEIESGQPVSDYDGLIELQDTLNAKQTQIARVLQKHADPKVFFVTNAADTNGNVNATHDAFFGDSPESMPKYITWNAELQSAIEDRKFAVSAICLAAELSQVLLGIKEGAAPDSARKLRLEMTSSIAKAARKAAMFRPGIKRAIALALQFDGISIDPATISVEMRDGIPDDELDRANVIATYMAAGAISLESALQLRGLDPKAVQDEVARIEKRAAANAPSALLGEPQVENDPNGSPAGVAGDEEELVAA